MSNSTRQPEILYHYTSIDALFSILDHVKFKTVPPKIFQPEPESFVLQATRVDYFNDPEEYAFLGSSLVSAMKEYEKLHSELPVKKSEYLPKGSFTEYEIFDTKPYLISLSEQQDSLSMWRFYGQDGKGVSLGFDRKKLEQMCDDKSNLYLTKCEYLTPEEAIRKLTAPEYYDKALEMLKGEFDRESRWLIKHKSYEDEHEWRLVLDMSVNPEKINHKVRSTVIIPYSKITFPIEALCHIIVGPCTEGRRTRRSIFEFCSSKSIYITDGIDISNVPYILRK